MWNVKRTLEKLILQVYVRQTINGMQMAFNWPTGAKEALENAGVLSIVGENLAQFGEQLKMEGLGLAKGPALIYGPRGEKLV